jgi:predicted nucleic acid-binding Zn ribbon protein
MSTYGQKHAFTKAGYSTRDAKLRCMQCGTFAAGKPLCDKCTDAVMGGVEARRRRMQLVFYYILILAGVAYYLIL